MYILKTIAIANQKGGTGKTSTCLELCSILGERGYKVLAIDLDQQKNLSIYCGADINHASIYDALHGHKSITECVQHVNTYDIIISSTELSRADREFVDRDDVYLLADLLGFVKDEYDYVIIDNSPSRNILLSMVYVAADYILIPTEADHGSIVEGISAVYQDINKLRNGRTKISHVKVLGFILTKYENTVLHSLAIEDLNKMAEEMEEDNPFVATVRKSIAMSECKRVFQSLQEYEKYSNPAQDYRKVADMIEESTK